MNKLISLIVALLCALSLFAVTSLSTQSQDKESVIIARVIDGDTFQLKDGRTIRLLNINAPEKNTEQSKLSIEYMKWFQNKQVEVEIMGEDKYKRNLAKMYAPEYVNKELVEKGLANKFLVQEDELKQFDSAEKTAIINSLGIWKKSVYYGCIDAKVLAEEELVTIEKSCNISLQDWKIKEEGRKIYTIKQDFERKINIHTMSGDNNETDLFWNSNQNIWNNDRDTLYVFDKEGDIAFYSSYGY